MVGYGLSLRFVDADGDGLSVYTEMTVGFDPNCADTDMDSLSDYHELIQESNTAGENILLSPSYLNLLITGTVFPVATFVLTIIAKRKTTKKKSKYFSPSQQLNIIASA
mgnify:CR=1 FL=1